MTGLSSGKDLIAVIRFQQLTGAVTEQNVPALIPALIENVRRYEARVGKPRLGIVSGLPAVSFPSSQVMGGNAVIRSTFLFLGRDEYRLDCQWLPAQRVMMIHACAQALATMRAS